jgi:DNA-binding GntR family transcriptional regulator
MQDFILWMHNEEPGRRRGFVMNVVKTVRDQIEEGILTVRYAPGERLDEMRLAEEYGVSRTPIREALKQLSENGLIEIRHRRGAIVTNPQPHQILEKFEVMSELEGAAGARAAQRFTTDDKLALLAAHEACANSASTEDTDRYYYDNEQFHKVIYAASHCGFLAEQCHSCCTSAFDLIGGYSCESTTVCALQFRSIPKSSTQFWQVTPPPHVNCFAITSPFRGTAS